VHTKHTHITKISLNEFHIFCQEVQYIAKITVNQISGEVKNENLILYSGKTKELDYKWCTFISS